MYELASVGDLPLPLTSPSPSNKRDRDSDSPHSTGENTNTSPISGIIEGPRVIAGSRRVSKAPARQESGTGFAPIDYQLPIHSHELGRIPLHPGIGLPSSAPMDTSTSAGSGWFHQQTASSSIPTLPPVLPSMQTVPNTSGVDPTMTSLFSIDPLMYEEMMSTLGAGDPFSSGMGGNSQQGFGMMPPPQQQQQQGMPQMDPSAGLTGQEDVNTLAMWSTAPTGFE